MELVHVERLKKRLREIHNIGRAAALLKWDQSTYMPPLGAAARASQLATLESLVHRMFIDDETKRLLDDAENEVLAAGLPADDDSVCLITVTRRDYTRSISLPQELVEEVARTSALAYGAWVTARASNDFSSFAPWLEKVFGLARRQAEHVGYEATPYDALLDVYEPGMTVARLEPFFEQLRAGLTPVLEAITEHDTVVESDILYREYEEQAQLRFAEQVVQRLGYDFERGRMDLTAHPFATSFSRDDVRITTRVEKAFFSACLMGTIHEAGHGLYEQYVAPELAETPLGSGVSLGIHESQSRLWENVIGRSCPFWEFFFPLVQQAFPAQLRGVNADDFYRALNHVSPSAIRVEADEVTYNFHIMLRFEIERRLVEGTLAIKDLPEAWNALTQQFLGFTPADDTQGVLQDMHWSASLIGYFPTYTLGNVLSVQLYDKALSDLPSIIDDTRRGEFGQLLGWMRENIHRHGRKFQSDDLIVRATGEPLTVEPYLRYLREKFGAIYGFSL